MRRQWIFLQNPFNTVTIDNYTLAVSISTFHLAALKSASDDAFFNGLYMVYKPVHDAFNTAYNNWKSEGELKQGQTLNLAQLLVQLRRIKIKQWDIAIQNTYEQSSPKYKALLPRRRVPFHKGKQLSRIDAIKTLALNIGSDAALASVKADIEAFFTQLHKAYDEQKGKKARTKTSSSDVETARITMCNLQYSNLGLLMSHFAAMPGRAAAFFDLKNIREVHQTLFKRQVAAGSVSFVVKHTFEEGGRIALKNTGNTELVFYRSQTKKAARPATVVIVPPLSELVVEAIQLGSLDHTYLNVFNSDVATGGRCEIRLL